VVVVAEVAVAEAAAAGVEKEEIMRKVKYPAVLLGLTLLLVTTSFVAAQQRFKSPEEATDALVTAARAGDRSALLRMLGRGSAQIIDSGDRAADDETLRSFVSAYDIKHRVDVEGGTSAKLLIGERDWPFPIPLVQERNVWRFDTAAGRQEILYRRIGRNEMAAGKACLAYFDAQNEYAAMDAQAPRERKTGCTGRRRQASPRVRLANSLPPQANVDPWAPGNPITAITIGF
jgi:hypothetical protein